MKKFTSSLIAILIVGLVQFNCAGMDLATKSDDFDMQKYLANMRPQVWRDLQSERPKNSVPDLAPLIADAKKQSLHPHIVQKLEELNTLRQESQLQNTTNRGVCCLAERLETIEEEIAQCCNDIITTITTQCGGVTSITQADLPYFITTPGNYCLAEDVTSVTFAAITILTNNVYLDLNGHTIDMSGVGTYGVYAIGGSDLRVHDGQFNSGAVGIEVESVYYMQIDNIVTQNCSIGINVLFSGTIRVSDSLFELASIGLKFGTDSVLSPRNCDNCTAIRCVADQIGLVGFYALTLGGDLNNLAFQDCSVTNMSSDPDVIGFSIYAAGAFPRRDTIKNVALRNCAVDNVLDGVGFAARSTDNDVLGVSYENCAASDVARGFELLSETLANKRTTVRNITYQNCAANSATLYGFRIDTLNGPGTTIIPLVENIEMNICRASSPDNLVTTLQGIFAFQATNLSINDWLSVNTTEGIALLNINLATLTNCICRGTIPFLISNGEDITLTNCIGTALLGPIGSFGALSLIGIDYTSFGIIIDNCEFSHPTNNGVFINGDCRAYSFNNCLISNCANNGVLCTANVLGSPNCIEFTNCQVAQNNIAGLNVGTANSVVVSDCVLNYNPTNIRLSGSTNSTIKNCEVSAATSNGIELLSAINCAVLNSVVSTCTTTGILIDATSNRSSIRDNSVITNGVGINNAGINSAIYHNFALNNTTNYIGVPAALVVAPAPGVGSIENISQ